MNRRSFLRHSTGLATSLAAVGIAGRPILARAARSRQARGLHLSTNAYSWHVFYQREGRNFAADVDQGLADVKRSGLDGFEPSAGSPAEIAALAPLLRKHDLGMRSLYVGSSLHTKAEADKSIESILSIAREARASGTRIVVTNPNPLQWGGPQNKDDAQLRTQADALNRLGRELRALGITLAYHNHDIELRNAAREFHHMLAGTDPKWVSLCLDAHWVYRGAGNSQVALFDVVRLYGERIVELHLRQSSQGIWSETFGPGDIDYPALAKAILEARRRLPAPHLVLEIAVEKGTPKTVNPGEAHRLSAEEVRRTFAGYVA